MRRKASGQGDKAALLALLGIAILFAFIVGRGWHTLVSTYGLPVSLPIGALMAAIALALAYAIAAERTHHPGSKTFWAYFFVLFNISALGAVNAMFVMFQSSNVFREEIDKANETIVTLRDTGASAINTSDYERFKADIAEKWRNLRAELDNPQLCGQGPVAAQRIAELQVSLPSFRPLGGGGRCEKVPALIASYEKQIAELTKESPIYLAAKKKLDLREHIQSEANAMLDEVADIRKGLNGTLGVATIKARLLDVAQRYSVARQELLAAGITGTDKIPLKIDTRATAAIGDIGQVIPFIVTRLGEVSTYIYVGIALVLDLAAIAAFARVLRVGPSRSQRVVAGTLRRV